MRRKPRPQQAPSRPDVTLATVQFPAAPGIRRRTRRERLALFASWPCALIWGIALLSQFTDEPYITAGERVVRGSIALVGVVGGVATTKFSLRPFPPDSATSDSLWTGVYVALGSLIPGVGLMAAFVVPYLVGVSLHAGGHGHRVVRAVRTALVCGLAVASMGYWAFQI
jgi:hypothetical protein